MSRGKSNALPLPDAAPAAINGVAEYHPAFPKSRHGRSSVLKRAVEDLCSPGIFLPATAWLDVGVR